MLALIYILIGIFIASVIWQLTNVFNLKTPIADDSDNDQQGKLMAKPVVKKNENRPMPKVK